MIVRKAQLEAMQKEQGESFVERMLTHLRRHFAEELAELDDASLRARIEARLEAARGYGLSAERDLSAFLELGASFGWDFDQEAWVQGYLTDDDLDPKARLSRVRSRYVKQLQAEIENQKAREAFDA